MKNSVSMGINEYCCIVYIAIQAVKEVLKILSKGDSVILSGQTVQTHTSRRFHILELYIAETLSRCFSK